MMQKNAKVRNYWWQLNCIRPSNGWNQATNEQGNESHAHTPPSTVTRYDDHFSANELSEQKHIFDELFLGEDFCAQMLKGRRLYRS